MESERREAVSHPLVAVVYADAAGLEQDRLVHRLSRLVPREAAHLDVETRPQILRRDSLALIASPDGLDHVLFDAILAGTVLPSWLGSECGGRRPYANAVDE